MGTAHTPHTWINGETITAALLNALETDLTAAGITTVTLNPIDPATSANGNYTNGVLTLNIPTSPPITAATQAALDTKANLTQLTADEAAAVALTNLVNGRALNTVTGTITNNATLVGSARNPVDGTNTILTVTLPAPAYTGQPLLVERIDTSTRNPITVAAVNGAAIRGNTTATIVLPAVGVANESLLFIAESSTSWMIAAGHKPKGWLDAVYKTGIGYKGLLDATWESATTRSPSYSQGTTGLTIGGNGANAQSATSFPLVNTLAVQIAPAACTKLRVAYGAFYYGTDLPNALPIQDAAIEYPHASGNIYPLTFSGARGVTLQAGAVLLSDELTIPGGITAGAQYNVRTSVYFSAPTSGQAWPSYDTIKGLDKNQAAATGSTNGVTNTYATFPSGNSAGYGPCAIFGNSGAAARSVAAVGDSILQGVSDPNTANGVGNGYMHRALAGSTIGIANIGRHAERAADWNTSTTRHRQRIAYTCSHAEVNYGINDIRIDSPTLGVLQARSIAVWRDLAAAGLKVRQHTITPNSTSTDSFATTTNQTVASAAQNTVRVAYNTWIRAGAPIDAVTGLASSVGSTGAITAGQAGHPLVGYREIANAVESAQDSGLWIANYTSDGLHPLTAGHVAMAAVITPASIT